MRYIFIIASIFIMFAVANATPTDTLFFNDGSIGTGRINVEMSQGLILIPEGNRSEFHARTTIDSIHYDIGSKWYPQRKVNLGSADQKAYKSTLRGGVGFGTSIPFGGIGMSIFTVNHRNGPGWYLDALFPFNGIVGNDNYYDHSEVWAGTTLGDLKKGEKTTVTIFHIGRCKEINHQLTGYAGIGFSKLAVYAKYYDPLEILSSDGNYYVNATDGAEFNMSIICGGFFTFESSTLQGLNVSLSGLPFCLQIGGIIGF